MKFAPAPSSLQKRSTSPAPFLRSNSGTGGGPPRAPAQQKTVERRWQPAGGVYHHPPTPNLDLSTADHQLHVREGNPNVRISSNSSPAAARSGSVGSRRSDRSGSASPPEPPHRDRQHDGPSPTKGGAPLHGVAADFHGFAHSPMVATQSPTPKERCYACTSHRRRAAAAQQTSNGNVTSEAIESLNKRSGGDEDDGDSPKPRERLLSIHSAGGATILSTATTAGLSNQQAAVTPRQRYTTSRPVEDTLKKNTNLRKTTDKGIKKLEKARGLSKKAQEERDMVVAARAQYTEKEEELNATKSRLSAAVQRMAELSDIGRGLTENLLDINAEASYVDEYIRAVELERTKLESELVKKREEEEAFVKEMLPSLTARDAATEGDAAEGILPTDLDELRELVNKLDDELHAIEEEQIVAVKAQLATLKDSNAVLEEENMLLCESIDEHAGVQVALGQEVREQLRTIDDLKAKINVAQDADIMGFLKEASGMTAAIASGDASPAAGGAGTPTTASTSRTIRQTTTTTTTSAATAQSSHVTSTLDDFVAKTPTAVRSPNTSAQGEENMITTVTMERGGTSAVKVSPTKTRFTMQPAAQHEDPMRSI